MAGLLSCEGALGVPSPRMPTGRTDPHATAIRDDGGMPEVARTNDFGVAGTEQVGPTVPCLVPGDRQLGCEILVGTDTGDLGLQRFDDQAVDTHSRHSGDRLGLVS